MAKKKISARIVNFVLACDIQTLGRLNVKSLAIHFGIGKKYMTETFKKETGSALDDYLISSKIYRAAFLLAQKKNRLTIKEISNKLGFYDSSTFARQFWLHLGVDPWRWRNLTKKQE